MGLGTTELSATDRWGTNGCLALIEDRSQEQVIQSTCHDEFLILLNSFHKLIKAAVMSTGLASSLTIPESDATSKY